MNIQSDLNKEYTNRQEAEFRRQWTSNDKTSQPLTKNDLYRILRRNNLISRLRRRAIFISVLGLTGPFWILALSCMVHVSTFLTLIYSVFMIANGLASLYWWYRLGKVYNYMSITLIDAYHKMDSLNNLRRNIKITSWIVGAPVIFLLFYEIAHEGEPLLFKGAVVGAIIGLVIGLTLEFLNRRQVKAIKKSFEEESEFTEANTQN